MVAERIVSLLPSATEIVCALGLEERLVAVSHSCDYPPSVTNRPRLTRLRSNLDGLASGAIDAAVRAALRDHGSVYEIDIQAIRGLEPDLVITQGICDVCAVPKSQVVAAAVGSAILTLDAHDLAAIFASIRDVGCATGVSDRAEEVIASIRERIAAVQERVAGRPSPRVLALEWLDPPYVPGHWIPELIAAAGGDLVAGTARRPSYRVTWSELRELDPDVLLIMPCGFDLETARKEGDCHVVKLHQVAGRALAADRGYVVDASSYFSRSGPRVADGVEIAGALLHPECFEPALAPGCAAIFPKP